MTVPNFLKRAEAYYGKYANRWLRDHEISAYLARFTGPELNLLWEAVKLEFSNQYKTPPDIAVLESAKRHHNEEAARAMTPGIGLGLPAPVRPALPEDTGPLEDRREEVAAMLRRLLARWGVRRTADGRPTGEQA